MIPAPAGGRLRSVGILFFALAAATPLTVVAGSVPTVAYALIGLVLLIFSAGYGAMSRRAPNAGALYAIVARGLGRPLGLGAAWIALLSYTAIQLALYGLIARSAMGLPWWQAVIAAWVLVAILGLCRADVVGLVLTVLVLAEVAVIVGYSAADVLHPAGGLTWPTYRFDRPAVGLMLVGAALAFVGFETTTSYAEEARSARRPTALAIVVLTILFAGAAWAGQVAAGPASSSFFDLAADRLAPWAVTLGRAVLLTGLLAGAVALHHTIKRYLFALGRDRVLPRGSASLTQTVLAGVLLAGAWRFGLTPGSRLVQWLMVGGSIGVLMLLTAASLAALLHLNRAPNGENAWRRFLAPALSTVAFGALDYLAFANLHVLLGVAGRQVWVLPGVLAAAVLLGLVMGLIMRAARPVAYAAIGLGGTAVVVSPTSPPIPEQRTPGAHRPERVKIDTDR